MAISISFELDDEDLEHIRTMAREAQASLQAGVDEETVIGAYRKVFKSAAKRAVPPKFIGQRLSRLETLVGMLEDEEWHLEEEDHNRVLSAMAYFANPGDLIPDRVPGRGFLDDAVMIELITENLTDEIASYRDFCQFRSVEEERRAAQSLPTDVSRDEWLADRRAALKSRMRRRRQDRLGGAVTDAGWRVSLW